MESADNLIWFLFGGLLGGYIYHLFLKAVLWMGSRHGKKTSSKKKQSSGLLNFGKPRPFQLGDLELLYAPERSMKGYTREKFGPGLHVKYKGESETPRDAALMHYGANVKRVGIAIVSGTWQCPYTGKIMTHPRELQIDHVVPLSEAWRSGADLWTQAQREKFARDPANLIPVAKEVNQAKSGYDIAQWLPEYNREAYIITWLNVKAAYGLTLDHAEIKLLEKTVKT